MTIKEKSLNSEERKVQIFSLENKIIDNVGLTKEQILLNELKTLAKEYFLIEQL